MSGIKDHHEAYGLQLLIEKARKQLIKKLSSGAPNSTLSKKLNYLKNTNPLRIGVLALGFAEKANIKLNTPTACIAGILAMDGVTDWITNFHQEIKSGNTAIDWHMAIASLGKKQNDRLVLVLNDASKISRTNATNMNEQDSVNGSTTDESGSNHESSSEKLRPVQVRAKSSTTTFNKGRISGERKRPSQLLALQPVRKQKKLLKAEKRSDVKIAAANITYAPDDGNGERRQGQTLRIVTEFGDAKISIVINSN